MLNKTKNNNFKGLTLDEIRYRKLVTHIKIDMTREQMRMYFDASLNSGNSAQAIKLASNWSKLVKWAEYGMMGYRAFRQISSFLKGVKAESK